MKSIKDIENLINDLNNTTSPDMDKKVLRDTFRAMEKTQEASPSLKADILTKITMTHIYASIAAAVTITAIFIGIYLFSNFSPSRGGHPATNKSSGTDKQSGRETALSSKATVEKPVMVTEAKKTTETAVRTRAAKVGTEKTESKLKLELASIEQLFRANSIDGLISMLSNGEYESKVAAANYLAKIGTSQAIEPLEKISKEYGAHNSNNPFAQAAAQIKSRVAIKKADESSTAIEIPKADAAIIAAEKTISTPTRGQSPPPDSPKLSEPSPSTEQANSLQADAKEAADGYPVKEGLNQATQAVPAGLFQNLVFYYSFYAGEDPNTAIDISGNNIHGQVYGAKYAQDEILGGTLSFDGQDDYIIIPDIYLGAFTIAAWVKTPDAGSMNNRRIFTLYDEGHCYAVEGNVRGGISVGAEKMEMDDTTTRTEGESDTTAPTEPEDNQRITSESEWSRANWAEGAQFSDYDWRLKSNTWTHITVTYDGQIGRIYRNGRMRERGHIPAAGFTGTAYIGGINKHNGLFWRGMLDEVALFNRALTEEEVGQLFLATGEMIAAGPVLAAGASGNGYYFDGDRDYIDIGPISGLGAEQTKMLWVNIETSPLTQEVYLIDEGGKNNWIGLFDSDGSGAVGVRAGFDEENYFDSEGRIMQGQWCHIAVVSTTSGDIDIYINGVPDSSATGFSTAGIPQSIIIGGQSAGFKGIIDEVAVFNRALTVHEIRQVYQNAGRLRGDEQGLVGYWSFDNDEADIVKDSSPSRNDGKLSNI